MVVCWWQISSVFVELKIILFLFHIWMIISLDFQGGEFYSLSMLNTLFYSLPASTISSTGEGFSPPLPSFKIFSLFVCFCWNLNMICPHTACLWLFSVYPCWCSLSFLDLLFTVSFINVGNLDILNSISSAVCSLSPLSGISIMCMLHFSFFLHFSLGSFCIQMGISFLFPLPLASLLFPAICKASSDKHFAFLYFFFLGGGLDHCFLYHVTSLHP